MRMWFAPACSLGWLALALGACGDSGGTAPTTVSRDLAAPERDATEALVRVLCGGICGTDLELLRGYRPFSGIPGHEFVGVVEARRESRVGFELGGELAEILVEDGDSVEAGAVLARLETSILRSERETLMHARDHARASLELAEITRGRVGEMHARAVASPLSASISRPTASCHSADAKSLMSASRRVFD